MNDPAGGRVVRPVDVEEDRAQRLARPFQGEQQGVVLRTGRQPREVVRLGEIDQSVLGSSRAGHSWVVLTQRHSGAFRRSRRRRRAQTHFQRLADLAKAAHHQHGLRGGGTPEHHLEVRVRAPPRQRHTGPAPRLRLDHPQHPVGAGHGAAMKPIAALKRRHVADDPAPTLSNEGLDVRPPRTEEQPAEDVRLAADAVDDLGQVGEAFEFALGARTQEHVPNGPYRIRPFALIHRQRSRHAGPKATSSGRPETRHRARRAGAAPPGSARCSPPPGASAGGT